ncbi:hypothetical protein PM082_023687 [Marasmius tenuissimus]|nr:hypothetical protein PM082_023687 [Marasmius tenuissimus]
MHDEQRTHHQSATLKTNVPRELYLSYPRRRKIIHSSAPTYTTGLGCQSILAQNQRRGISYMIPSLPRQYKTDRGPPYITFSNKLRQTYSRPSRGGVEGRCDAYSGFKWTRMPVNPGPVPASLHNKLDDTHTPLKGQILNVEHCSRSPFTLNTIYHIL